MSKRMLQIATISFVLVLLTSTFVLAAGRSTGGEAHSHTTRAEVVAEIQAASESDSCSSLSTRRLRIACRLQAGEFDTDTTIDESCANHENQKACNALYKGAYTCYIRSGHDKDVCFKQISNFKRAKAQDQAGIDKKPLRNYIVLVLYNLQERVEYQFDEGKLTSEEATELIDQIVEIKQVVFAERTPAEIRPMIKQLKSDWRDMISNE